MKSVVGIAATLILAAAAQPTIAPRIAIFGVMPDISLVAVTILCMSRNSNASAVIGFFAGLLAGGTANTKMGAFIISRVLAAVAVSVVGRSSVAATRLTVALAAAVCSLVAALAYMLLGVPANLLEWFAATVGGLVYNVLLVLGWTWLFPKRNRRD